MNWVSESGAAEQGRVDLGDLSGDCQTRCVEIVRRRSRLCSEPPEPAFPVTQSGIRVVTRRRALAKEWTNKFYARARSFPAANRFLES
jgi:hypothetical protein